MNVHRTTRGRRLAVRLAAVTAVAVLAALQATGPATADDQPTQAPTPEATAKEQVVPSVQASIVYETITFSAYVYDPLLEDETGATGTFVRDTPFQVTFQCTGFVVNPNGYIATAGHCLDTEEAKRAIAEKAALWYLDGTTAYPVDELVADYELYTYDRDAGEFDRDRVDRTVNVSYATTVAGTTVAKNLPARVIGAQRFEKGDAALLKVNSTDLNAIALAEGVAPAINSEVIAVGYPAVIESYTDLDLVPTFNPGTISSTKTVAGGLFPVLQLSAGLSGGMSGGPTVNLDGEVVGINSSGFDGEPINYAMPIAALQELLADKGVPAEVGETTLAYREGLAAYFAGDKGTAVRQLSAVVEQQPANSLAVDYLARAQDLPDPAPEPAATEEPAAGSQDWLYLAGGVALAVLLVLAAVVGTVSARRRRATYPAAPQVPWQAAPQHVAPPAPVAPVGFAPAHPDPAGVTVRVAPAPWGNPPPH